MINSATIRIKHVPGKELYTADTLSRAPIQSQNADSPDMQEIAELCMMSIIKHLPASNQRLEMYRKAQSEDPICQQLVRYCQTAWPDMKDLDPSVRVYWQFRGEMTIKGGLLLRGQRIVVPKSLQTETLTKLHDGHQGNI